MDVLAFVIGLGALTISFVPCFGMHAMPLVYLGLLLGGGALVIGFKKKQKFHHKFLEILLSVLAIAFSLGAFHMVREQEKLARSVAKDMGEVAKSLTEIVSNTVDLASNVVDGVKATSDLMHTMRQARNAWNAGMNEIDEGMKAIDKSLRDSDKKEVSTNKGSKDLDLVCGLLKDVAGKVAKEVDVDTLMDVAGKVVKDVDVDKVIDVAGKAVKELDMDKVMKAADEGIQAMDQIARSLNDGNGAQGTEAPLTKEQIKAKIQKWQNDRWKKDVIESARSEKGTVSASDLAETCETAELQSVMDLLIADYVLLVNGLDAYAAASDETAALKELTTSVSASDLTRIRDDGAKLKNALNDLKEKACLSDVSRMKALASDGAKFGKLALSVSDVCGVVKNLLAEAAQN